MRLNSKVFLLPLSLFIADAARAQEPLSVLAVFTDKQWSVIAAVLGVSLVASLLLLI